jgi:hypothetical protein
MIPTQRQKRSLWEISSGGESFAGGEQIGSPLLTSSRTRPMWKSQNNSQKKIFNFKRSAFISLH